MAGRAVVATTRPVMAPSVAAAVAVTVGCVACPSAAASPPSCEAASSRRRSGGGQLGSENGADHRDSTPNRWRLAATAARRQTVASAISPAVAPAHEPAPTVPAAPATASCTRVSWRRAAGRGRPALVRHGRPEWPCLAGSPIRAAPRRSAAAAAHGSRSRLSGRGCSAAAVTPSEPAHTNGKAAAAHAAVAT